MKPLESEDALDGMLKVYPFLLEDGPLLMEEVDDVFPPPRDFFYDREKKCFMLNGGELYMYSTPEPTQKLTDACRHCMFRFRVRMFFGEDKPHILCPYKPICDTAKECFKEELEGHLPFLQSTGNFRIGFKPLTSNQ